MFAEILPKNQFSLLVILSKIGFVGVLLKNKFSLIGILLKNRFGWQKTYQKTIVFIVALPKINFL